MISYPKGYSKQTINAFTFEIYNDSAPKNWLQILENIQVQAYVSPLHDKDLLENGEHKKPHYHVVVVFSGGKSEAFCQGIIDEVGGANGFGQVCRSIEGSIRYLVHTGSIDKYHYNPDDIICFAGAPLKKYFLDSDIEDTSTITQVISYIKDHRELYFSELIDYCIASKPSWLRCMRSSWFQSLIREYMRSLKERLSSQFQQSFLD